MTFHRNGFFAVLAVLPLVLSCSPPARQETASPAASADSPVPSEAGREKPFKLRPFAPIENGFRARGIAYGPYRTGQRPGGPEPSRQQLLEDLKLLAADEWQMIRIYGVEPFAETVCQIIRDEKLALKIMVGAWIATEQDNATQKDANQKQILGAIKLANEYPDSVVAVSVANESQVFWSFHKVEPSRLINYVRHVRASIKQPVTVADDFKYWITDESKTVAKEIDFIVTHIYAMWLGEQLEDALKFTQDTFEQVRAAHPDRVIVIGEAGWATRKSSDGDQAQRIKGQPGESEQQQFFEEYTAWLLEQKIPFFYFEAFDEPWKGGTDPDDVEKHWGLFREDRSPKSAIMKKQ